MTPATPEHIAVQPRQRAGAGAIAQQAVAADAGIDHRPFAFGGGQAFGQPVGPAAEGIAGGGGAFGDGIAQGHDHAVGADRIDFDLGHQRGQAHDARAGQRGRGGVVAGLAGHILEQAVAGARDIVPGTWMEITSFSSASVFMSTAIGQQRRAGGHHHAAVAVKGHGMVAARQHRAVGTGGADMHRAQHQRVAAAFIADAQAQALARHRNAHQLADGDVGRIGSRPTTSGRLPGLSSSGGPGGGMHRLGRRLADSGTAAGTVTATAWGDARRQGDGDKAPGADPGLFGRGADSAPVTAGQNQARSQAQNDEFSCPTPHTLLVGSDFPLAPQAAQAA